MSTQPHRRLERPPERMIAGVCSGLGEHFDSDPVLVRIAFVVLTVVGGAGVLAYLVLWIIMPAAGSTVALGAAGVGEGLRTMGTEMKDVGRDIRDSMAGSSPPPPPPPPSPPPPPAYGGAPVGAGTNWRSH
jgi:phage shock protein C